MTTPRQKYERRRETFEKYVSDGEIDPDTAEAIRELLDAYDNENVLVTCPSGESPREPSTMMMWTYNLMTFGRRLNLTEATVDDLKNEFQSMLDGSHPQVKAEGLAKSTIINYQSSLRRFYQYHDFGIDPEAIPLFSQDEPKIDPNDILDKDEIEKIRDAIDNPRDRAVFELLLNTGQRREAIRTLRIKDIDIQEGRYRLNPEVDGLKGATKRDGYRPLLGARGPVRTWLDFHPAPDDDEAYLITQRPNWSAVDPYEPVSGETIRRIMADIKEKAEIEKPMHPHMMRHNFVTMAKRDYELPDDTVKYLIGHDTSSMIMERTYSHLSDTDHIRRAEEGFGIAEVEESTLTPEACNMCGNPLGKSDRACSYCGEVYAPDAKAVLDDVESALWNDMREADNETDKSALDQLKQLLERNPGLVDELVDGDSVESPAR